MPNDQYRILCTRPLTDSSIAVAGENGIHIDVKDFIQIKPLPNEALWGPEKIRHLFRPGTVQVFTSANAVKILAKYYIRQGADWYIIRDANICCISGKTKQLLEETFLDCKILAEAAYGKDLATAIIQLGNITEVNFFCGTQRRDELPGILTAAGITVNEYVIYENIPTPEVVATDYDGIFFFSPSAVKSYFSANKLAPKTVCFAIGRTTATSLKEHTDNKIIISPGTDEAYMVQTAIFYFNNINCYE
ncbi:uroporphyrinogen-III synthase [Chitinophaga polysaccharea]|uniref:Uroporphyrinogen-III synthase n=1 Tax=Chitinophaga polysaccharea TaxID=1293035 RepID=A0A561PGD5_9BACT|nr:uroporphyrinogen-III synthase [Chitinophaga polysaccharea]TWF37110.1 uroporphyrinogen-III synthase [Chitinophaga polysaccharea]